MIATYAFYLLLPVVACLVHEVMFRSEVASEYSLKQSWFRTVWALLLLATPFVLTVSASLSSSLIPAGPNWLMLSLALLLWLPIPLGVTASAIVTHVLHLDRTTRVTYIAASTWLHVFLALRIAQSLLQ